MHLILAAILGVAVAAEAGLPDPLTLADATRAAMANNPELAASEAGARAAKASARGAGALPEPMLSYQAWQQPLARPFDPGATNMHMLGLRWPLPFPGQLGLAGRAAEAELHPAGTVEVSIPEGASRERPEVLAARLRAERAQTSAELRERARKAPDLMVGLDYMLMPHMPDASSMCSTRKSSRALRGPWTRCGPPTSPARPTSRRSSRWRSSRSCTPTGGSGS